MKKVISFEEFSNMSFEELNQIIKHNEGLPKGHEDRIEIEDPISGKSEEEIDELLRNHGYLPIEEVEERINAKLDEYAARKEPGSEETDSEQ